MLALDGWQQLDDEELWDLYSEAFGWRHCLEQNQETNVALQKNIKNSHKEIEFFTAREALFGSSWGCGMYLSYD